MKKAVIQLQIQAHEFDPKTHQCLEPVTTENLTNAGLKSKMVIHIDADDEFQLLTKVKQWIESAKG